MASKPTIDGKISVYINEEVEARLAENARLLKAVQRLLFARKHDEAMTLLLEADENNTVAWQIAGYLANKQYDKADELTNKLVVSGENKAIRKRGK